MNQLNTKILAIDDEESVLRNICLTLAPKKDNSKALSDAADALFGDDDATENKSDSASEAEIEFDISTAPNGQRGLELVNQALTEKAPYSLVICDMRMPGWDGLKTIEEIRAADPRIEVVFLTAFSDHSVQDIARSLGVNISYMSKPFSRPDLIQMVTRAVVEWNKARELELFVSTIGKLTGKEEDIETILSYIIGELSRLLDTESTAIAEQIDGKLLFRAGSGSLANQKAFDELSEYLNQDVTRQKVETYNGVHLVRIDSFGIAITSLSDTNLRPDKEHLIEVFLEHASIALKNCKLKNQLAESERLAEIGQAIGFVSHDIRGPLSQAEMLLKMLSSGRKLPWSNEEAYEKISHALNQAKELADDILQFSKSKMTINPCQTSMHDLISRNQDYWQHLADHYGIQFSVQLGSDANVLVDGARLPRAFTNIIKNAIEATSIQPEKSVSLTVKIENKDLVVSIEDTAGGIPADILPTLFKPFSTSGKSHGTGFGLAIADEVVRLHKGTIQVVGTEKGTQFNIRVPEVLCD